MKRLLLAGAFAAAAMVGAAPATAAIVFSFDAGVASPGAGYTVINTFDTALEQGLVTGAGFMFQSNNDGNGAPPANSNPLGTTYLTVLGGGSATIGLGGNVRRFQFDWGSIDNYNQLVINSSGADPVILPGSNFTNPANGNQVSPGTNGLFTVWSTAGETFNSITLSSGGNSFEIDNLAVAGVPEPLTWGLMIMGFGGVGAVLRRRRTAAAFA